MNDPTRRALLTASALSLGASIGVLVWVVAYLLWRVVRSARDGDPFSLENVSRLRWVAARARTSDGDSQSARSIPSSSARDSSCRNGSAAKA